jgi:hypothetical protein
MKHRINSKTRTLCKIIHLLTKLFFSYSTHKKLMNSWDIHLACNPEVQGWSGAPKRCYRCWELNTGLCKFQECTLTAVLCPQSQYQFFVWFSLFTYVILHLFNNRQLNIYIHSSINILCILIPWCFLFQYYSLIMYVSAKE